MPGDEVRDIDWKATARHLTLVRRYVATRKQNLVLVIDTGRGMAAAARGGEPKKSVANRRRRAVGYLAQRHGDLVGLVRGDATSTVAHPMRGNEALERLLRAIDSATTLDGEQSNLTTQLQWIVRNVRRRLLLLIVADDVELDPGLSDLLRRLHVQHEILWITVEDADPTSIDAARTTVDVADHAPHWCGRAPASGRPTHRRSPHAFGRRTRCSMRQGSTTPESARATRSSRPCSPCWRGSVVRAADSPPPASMRPTPAGRWLWIGVALLAVVLAWYAWVWWSTRSRPIIIPPRIAPDRLTRLRADYARQIDLVVAQAEEESSPNDALTSR